MASGWSARGRSCWCGPRPSSPVPPFLQRPVAALLGRLNAAALEQGVQCVVLPRTASQAPALRSLGGLLVPERVVDSQSLCAFADVVVSAGGTMNREAVALGTPAYTTFAGRMGAVDERLIAEGRLHVLSSPEQLDLGRREHGSPLRGPRPPSAARAGPERARRRRLLTPAGRPFGALPVGLGPYNPVQCADGSVPRPSRSTDTRCRNSQSMGRWSRSRTTSPSSCASTAGPPATTPTFAKTRSGG